MQMGIEVLLTGLKFEIRLKLRCFLLLSAPSKRLRHEYVYPLLSKHVVMLNTYVQYLSLFLL